MKTQIITLTAIGALSLGSFALGQDQQADSQGWHRHGGRGNPIEHMTDHLNLTPEQKAKIQPIIDQAKPQIEQIHREAMEKMKAIMDNVKTQIRPILTADQQKQLDEMHNHRGMHRHGNGEDQGTGADDDQG